MKAKAVYFQEVLREKLKDPEFRRHYEQEREVLEVASRILEVRQQLGLSQEEFAKRAGTTLQVVAKVENGDYEGYSLKTLRKLARAAGVTMTVRFGKRTRSATATPGKMAARHR